MKPKGYIIWESPVVVAIATLSSANRKTGNMVQTWILRKDQSPVSAVISGEDSVICGNCPLRGLNGQTRTCYVNVGQAPLAIWRSWKAGKYPKLPGPQVFAGRKIRLGAYGDPAAVPVSVWRSVLSQASGWTGYSHQWRRVTARAFKGLVMASVETEEDTRKAQAMGWRTFRVRPVGADLYDSEIQCPEKKVSCEQCGLCKGTSSRAKSISIEAHGSGKIYLQVE